MEKAIGKSKEGAVSSADAAFLQKNPDLIVKIFPKKNEIVTFLHKSHYFSDDYFDNLKRQEKEKPVRAEISSLSFEEMSNRIFTSTTKEWEADPAFYSSLLAEYRVRYEMFTSEQWLPVKMRFWAEGSSLSNKTFEEHLAHLGIEHIDVEGKAVLVLGPGTDFAFEKGLADAGANPVVALSYSFEHHESPEKVHTQYPAIQPVRGLFQALPPADNTFDCIYSVHAFPRGVDAVSKDIFAKLSDPKEEKRIDIKDLKERFSAVISLLTPGGEFRCYPILGNMQEALQKLPKNVLAQIAIETKRTKDNWYDDILIIRKLNAPTAE